VEDILARASLLSAELGGLAPARPAGAARSAGAPDRQGADEGSPARPAGAGAGTQEPRTRTCLPGPQSSGSGAEAAPAQAAPRRPSARAALGPASLPADSHAPAGQLVRGARDGHAQGVDAAGFPPACAAAAPPCSPRPGSTSACGGGQAAGSAQQGQAERPAIGRLSEREASRSGGGAAQSAARQPAGRAGPERAGADGGGGSAQEAAARPGGRDGREAAAAALDAFAAKLGRHAGELQPRTRQARLSPVIPSACEQQSQSSPLPSEERRRESADRAAAAHAAGPLAAPRMPPRLEQQQQGSRPLPTCRAARSVRCRGGPAGCGGAGRL